MDLLGRLKKTALVSTFVVVITDRLSKRKRCTLLLGTKASTLAAAFLEY